MFQCVKTHLRDMIIVPEMIGSIVGIYNGKTANQVEIKVGAQIWPMEACRSICQVILSAGWFSVRVSCSFHHEHKSYCYPVKLLT